MGIDFSKLDRETIGRILAGRKRYLAKQRHRRAQRRAAIAKVISELASKPGGIPRGMWLRLAAEWGCDKSLICKEAKAILQEGAAV